MNIIRSVLPHVDDEDLVSELFLEAEFDDTVALRTTVRPQPAAEIKSGPSAVAAVEATHVRDAGRLAALAKHTSVTVRRAVAANSAIGEDTANYLLDWGLKKNDPELVTNVLTTVPCARALEMIDEHPETLRGFDKTSKSKGHRSRWNDVRSTRVAYLDREKLAQRLLDAGTREDLLRGVHLDTKLSVELIQAYRDLESDATPAVTLTELVEQLPADNPHVLSSVVTELFERQAKRDILDTADALRSLASLGVESEPVKPYNVSSSSHRFFAPTVLTSLVTDPATPTWLVAHAIAAPAWRTVSKLSSEVRQQIVDLVDRSYRPQVDSPEGSRWRAAAYSLVTHVDEVEELALQRRIGAIAAREPELGAHLVKTLVNPHGMSHVSTIYDDHKPVVCDEGVLVPVLENASVTLPSAHLEAMLGLEELPTHHAALTAARLAALPRSNGFVSHLTYNQWPVGSLDAVIEHFGAQVQHLLGADPVADRLAVLLQREFGADAERWRTFVTLLPTWTSQTSELIDTVHELNGGRPAPAADDEVAEPDVSEPAALVDDEVELGSDPEPTEPSEDPDGDGGGHSPNTHDTTTEEGPRLGNLVQMALC